MKNGNGTSQGNTKVKPQSIWSKLTKDMTPAWWVTMVIALSALILNLSNSHEGKALTWHAVKAKDGGLTLTQAQNTDFSVESISLRFPIAVREAPLDLGPGETSIPPEVVETGIEAAYAPCVRPNISTPFQAQIPVAVTTHYVVAGHEHVADDLYSLNFLASITRGRLLGVELIGLTGGHSLTRDDNESVTKWKGDVWGNGQCAPEILSPIGKSTTATFSGER